LSNDGDSDLNSIFNISLEANPFHKLNHTIELVSYKTSEIIRRKKGKKIGDRSITELVGPTFEEFKDSNRYVTKKKTSHIFIFKIIFENPWYVSVN